MISLMAASSVSARRPSFSRNSSKLSLRSTLPFASFFDVFFVIIQVLVCAPVPVRNRVAASSVSSFRIRAAVSSLSPRNVENDAGDPPAGQTAAPLPKPIPERAAIGHSNRPAELNFLNILSKGATVVFRKREQPFPDGPAAAWRGVKPTDDFFDRSIMSVDCVKNGTHRQQLSLRIGSFWECGRRE